MGPVPEREIVVGEFVALLATVTLPVMLRAADGAKVKLSAAVCPGVRVCPAETPLAANPAPEMLRLEIVTLEFPAFVRVTPRTLLLPTVTFPKLRLVRLAFRSNIAGFTVRVAALLVTFPTELVTFTVNWAPLSDAVVAGVTYDDVVAPAIAAPFLFH